MVGAQGSNSSVSYGGSGSGGVSEAWVDENYLSKDFFNSLFAVTVKIRTLVKNGENVVSDTTSTRTISPNDIPEDSTETNEDSGNVTVVTVTIDNIQAKAGFWTNSYMSALGQNDDGGDGGGSSATLADLLDVNLGTLSNGQALVYNSTQGKWVNSTIQSSGGTVRSVGLSMPAGFSVAGSPITDSGTLAVSFASGYSLPTTAMQNVWSAKQDAISDLATIRSRASHGETAYGWGDHSAVGYASEMWVSGNFLGKYGGNMTGQITMQGSDIRMGTSGSSSNDSSDLVWLYGDGDEKARIWLDDTYTSGGGLIGPNFKAYDANGSLIGSTRLALLTDNVASASRLAGNSQYTAWGQTFWQNGVPNSISGSLTDVTDISMNRGLQGAQHIELNNSTPHGSANGGYIDFHYNGSLDDFTSRIIEDANGRLNINNAIFAYLHGNVGIGTNSAEYKLTVAGNVYSSNCYYAKGSSSGGFHGVTDGGNFDIQYGVFSACGDGNFVGAYSMVRRNHHPVTIGLGYDASYSGNYVSFSVGSTRTTEYNSRFRIRTDESAIEIGDILLSYDQQNNALKVSSRNGTAANLYAVGGVSALGFAPGPNNTDFVNITTANIETLTAGTAGFTGSISSPKYYLDATRYLYVSTNGTLYFYNGTTAKQVAFVN